METTDVMEDLWIMDSNSSWKKDSPLKINIPTELLIKNVKPKLELSKSPNLLMSLKEMLIL
jgi:hypothetical protein